MAAVAATLGLYRAGVADDRDPGVADDRDAARGAPDEGRGRGRASRPSGRRGRDRPAFDGRRGSLPGETLPSVGRRDRRAGRPIACSRHSAARRAGPVIGRIEDGRVVLDLRTVAPERGRRPGRATSRRSSPDGHDRRRRHRRPYRPRQDDAAARADRHRRRPAARGAAARDDDRCRLRPPHARGRDESSTSSTSPGTTSWSATCSSAPARSTPRCWSSPPTTARARRRSSTWRCWTRLASRPGSRSSPRSTRSTPERVASGADRGGAPSRPDVAGRSPVVLASGTTGDGVDAVRRALAALVEGDAIRRPRPASLAIDRVFSVKGRGVVVTGSLRGGPLAVGDRLRRVPGDEPVRVREIQVHGRRRRARHRRWPDGAEPRRPRDRSAPPRRHPDDRCRRRGHGSAARRPPPAPARPESCAPAPGHGRGRCGGRSQRAGRGRPR